MARSARIEAALVDLKGLAASAVIVHLLAMLRPAVGVGRRLIFQVRVVGCDGDSGAVLIKFDYSCFLDFLQSCFHVLDCGRMCYNGKKRRQPACGGATFFLVRIYENTARSPIEQYLSQKKIC